MLVYSSGNQVIYLSDSSSFIMNIRLDKTAADICEMAKTTMHCGGCNEEPKLVEVKSNGGKFHML